MTYNKSRVTSGKRDAVKSSNLLKPGGNKQDCSFNTNWTSVCCEKGVQLNYKSLACKGFIKCAYEQESSDLC